MLDRRPVVAVVIALLTTPAAAVYGASPQTNREQVMSAQYDSRPGSRLVVDVPDADVLLRNGASDRVEIEVWIQSRDLDRARERFEQMQFHADGNDNEVRVTAKPLRSDSWWDWRRWGGLTITVEITLPQRHDVDIKTSDGDIDAEALDGSIRLRTSDGDVGAERLAGTVWVETSDGDIVIRAIEADTVQIRTSDGDISLGDLSAQRIDVRTSDGDISATRLAAAEIVARTSDGDIALNSVTGALKAETHDGSIHVRFAGLGPSDLSTSDGDITIEAPQSLAAALDLRGSSLDLNSRFSFDGTLERGNARGDLNGGGPLLRARTHDGRILLRLNDDP